MSSCHVLSQSGRFGLKIVMGCSESEADSFSRQSILSTAVVVPARNTDLIPLIGFSEGACMIWLLWMQVIWPGEYQRSIEYCEIRARENLDDIMGGSAELSDEGGKSSWKTTLGIRQRAGFVSWPSSGCPT